MIDGFYAVYYTGTAGVGMGMLILQNGRIIGADVVGGSYDGTYKYDQADGTLHGTFDLHVPANVPLVSGAPPQPEPYSVKIPLYVKVGDPEKGMIFPVALPTGAINVSLKRLRKL